MELIKIEEFKVAMTSLQVAEITGKEHSKVMRDIEDEANKLGVDISQAIFGESEYKNERGKTYRMYNLSREGAMQLGARYDAKTRYKMIKRINELEAELVKVDTKTKLLADLFSDDKMVVVNAHKTLVELETKPLVEVIERQKPKVEYHDNVLNPQGLVTTTNIAKDLGMSAIQLNKILHEKGIQYKKSKTWLLYDKHQNKVPEYADYKIGEYGQSLQWTEKGRQWIIEILNK